LHFTFLRYLYLFDGLKKHTLVDDHNGNRLRLVICGKLYISGAPEKRRYNDDLRKLE
jgi:hypothetical protein